MIKELINKNQDELNNKNYGHRERIRKKALNHVESLFEYELLEALLFGVLPRRDTKNFAKEILKKYNGSLSMLFLSDFKEILKIKGLNQATFIFFKIIGQIFKKINSEVLLDEKISIDNFDLLLKFLRSHIAFSKKENFCEIFLNSQLEIIKFEIYDYGSFDQIAIYSKDIVFRALECGAKNLIISHNHPTQSSKIIPSEQDKEQTNLLNELCLSFEINLIDHIIVSHDQYFSFYSNGFL